MLVPINTVEDPETFKWEGVVDFDNGGRQAKLVAASHNAVVTVIPPGLEGEITLRVRGPEGRSNPVRINVDQSCSSNRGKEITEAQAREWADQVPEDLIERATDRTGQFINFEPGEILVQFEGAPGELEDLKSKYNIRSWERIPGTDFSVVRLEDRGIRNTLETADALSTEDRVRYAVENGLMTLLQAELNDPNIDQQEQLRATNMFTGWRSFFPTKGQGVTIAVVDTGLDLTVKDEVLTSPLAPNGVDVSGGHQDLSLLLGTSTAEDRRGHGTIVSSIASAKGDNSKLGAGVALNSRVIPIKVFGQSRFTPQDIIAKGLVAAFYLEADVVNMSLGCSRCRPSKERQTREYFAKVLDFLYEDFESQGLIPPIVVAATGNDAEGIVDIPAADPRVIAIGSYNLETGERSSFSNFGKEVDFVAPGENIYTTLLGGEFGDAGSGTSFSSPQGAGLVALILSTQPNLKELGVEAVREKIRECFIEDVGELGFDSQTGWGMIRVPDPAEVDPRGCLLFE
ncbi:MAG: S8 family peptidase [Candidatus Bipolaricaulota bacterium]